MAQLEATSSSCASAPPVTATSGTITLNQISQGHVTGSYTLTFGTQGSFNGSFDVETCTLPDGGAQAEVDAGPPECLP